MLGHSGQPTVNIARYVRDCMVMMPGAEMTPAAATARSIPSFPAAAATGSASGRGNGAGVSAGDTDELMTGDGTAAAAAAAPASDDDALRGDGGPEALTAEGEPLVAPAGLGVDVGAALSVTVGTGAGAGADERARHHGDDGVALSRALSHLDILTNTLLWRHLAPTAPDTLGCYPHTESDPFVIGAEHLPHLLFAGGAPAFGSRLVETEPAVGAAGGAQHVRVRVISVPDFSATRTVVLVNLRSPTLEAQPITFTVGRAEAEFTAAALGVPLPAGAGGRGR